MSCFPPPIVAVAIEPKTSAQRERLGGVLAELRAADPYLVASIDLDSGETRIAGADEAHLLAVLDLLKRAYDVEVGAPQAAYRERPTVRRDRVHAQEDGGGRREFARVKLLVEPNRPGGGASFVSELPMHAKFADAIAKGVRSVMEAIVLAGFPVDMKATLSDAALNSSDSCAVACEIAGRAAAREGLLNGECELLEPIIGVTVTTPEECVADVLSDLKSRGAQIAKSEAKHDAIQIAGKARMANMFGYADHLRILSRGRAACVMAFSHYARVDTPDGGPSPPAEAARG